MRKNLLNVLLVFGLLIVAAWQLDAQCKKVGLIGEFTSWSADFEMTRDLDNPDVFTALVNLDVDSDGNGFSDVKFRELGDWGVNWGDAAFPTGVGTPNGPNIQAPVGVYHVTFNCSTGAYTFVPTCGDISMIGEFIGWAGDHEMIRDAVDPNLWTSMITFDESSDQYGDSTIIELKFRMNKDWAKNWGGPSFPTGTGVQDGPNIAAPLGTYKVTFNCSTGDYNFEQTCGEISMIGEFIGWAGDHEMIRDEVDPNLWTSMITFDASSDQYGDPNIIELKFRMNKDWKTNWGAASFPTGTGTQDGPNIPATLGSYRVTFNCATGDYNFVSTCGDVSIIGAFNGWNGDVEMNRDADDPNIWHVYRSWNKDSQVKFRQNKDWSVNWGNNTWPTGTGTPNGPNIPLVAGKYDVTFNCNTGAYAFAANDAYCGEIGMVGDFNEWGLENADGFYTDALLKRDPNHPGNFSTTYTFSSGTLLLFREDGDLTYTNVWGGTFPSGTGVQDPSQFLTVPGGTYEITFNCLSGDFNFKRLGSSVYAPKVFAINVDGKTDENDWKINEPISKVLEGDGSSTAKPFFGVAYNDQYLYVGGVINDVNPLAGGAVIGVDADKSGGDYDAQDILFGVVAANGGVIVEHGPAGYTPTVKVSPIAGGWSFEAAIEWAKLGVTPAAGSQIGMDLVIVDGTHQLIWNGSGNGPSSFGAVNLGTLACGNISMYAETIGDVAIRPKSNDDGTNSNTYLGTYEFETAMNIVFRKDNSSTVSWGNNAFPSGTATVGGSAIPVAAGRYRVSFGCLDGSYSFTSEPLSATVAKSQFANTAPVIDGNLGEYTLSYGMDKGVVAGSGPINNTVTWGSAWDLNNVYFGVKVVDAKVEGSGNPWDNDAIEFYFDGNHDSDGKFDPDYDTQIIMYYGNNDIPWVKADGVQITDIEGKWFPTSNGYNVELRIGWDGFGFAPARNRTMGFSIGNNDSDKGIGRDYQSAWAGTGDNWNNTGVHGDLQLAGGPLASDIFETYFSEAVAVYPNPATASSGIHVEADTDIFNGDVGIKIYNLFGQVVSQTKVDLNSGKAFVQTVNLPAGTYFMYLVSQNGNQATKQIIIE